MTKFIDQKMREVIRRGDLARFEELLDQTALIPFNLILWDGQPATTVLHVAAKFGRAEMIEFALGQIQDGLARAALDINPSDAEGYSPLHLACRGGHTRAALVLLDAGANPVLPDSQGMTPLALAVAAGADELASLLFQRLSFPHKGELPHYPLCDAAHCGHGHVVKWLLAHHVDANEFRQYAFKGTREYALHCAAANDHREIVEVLLEGGADINSEDCVAGTALHRAAEQGHYGICALLIDRGAKITRTRCHGHSPLRLAVASRYLSTAEVLLDRGDDPNCADDAGASILDVAVELRERDIVRLLLDRGADPNDGRSVATRLSEVTGPSPLHLAIDIRPQALMSRPSVVLVKQLADRGANPNVQDPDGNTPLHLAARWGHEPIVRCLLRAKADPMIRNKADETAIDVAVKAGHRRVAERLSSREWRDVRKDGLGR